MYSASHTAPDSTVMFLLSQKSHGVDEMFRDWAKLHHAGFDREIELGPMVSVAKGNWFEFKQILFRREGVPKIVSSDKGHSLIAFMSKSNPSDRSKDSYGNFVSFRIKRDDFDKKIISNGSVTYIKLTDSRDADTEPVTRSITLLRLEPPCDLEVAYDSHCAKAMRLHPTTIDVEIDSAASTPLSVSASTPLSVSASSPLSVSASLFASMSSAHPCPRITAGTRFGRQFVKLFGPATLQLESAKTARGILTPLAPGESAVAKCRAGWKHAAHTNDDGECGVRAFVKKSGKDKSRFAPFTLKAAATYCVEYSSEINSDVKSIKYVTVVAAEPSSMKLHNIKNVQSLVVMSKVRYIARRTVKRNDRQHNKIDAE